ncbi:MAG: DUF169 domain-containing protein [Desulfobacterota bacterium]|jgi:uncharacterized protein (DUF169 family)|nr:DUF169 domain-containing protein [Thermodesulfobacteriota bacterium]
MSDFKTISDNLVEGLELKYAPVGVTLFGENEAPPAGISFTEENFKSYCQAIVLAGQGRALLLRRENMGCKLGTSVLGMETEMEAFLDDGVLEKFGVGLFATEEASAETLLKSVYLPQGQTRSVLIAPLPFFQETPQVVVFTADSEQTMWLLYALNYEKGGRQDLPQSGGALGGCADITAYPLLEGQANITFLGLGCRIKSAVAPADLMLGLPGGQLAALHQHILAMEKPMQMLKKARAK